MEDDRNQAAALLRDFARRTGLDRPDAPQRRYLWTDAFALCTALALDDCPLALRLVDAVHGTLGRFRDDDARRGWLSGPVGQADAAHPTRCGLRIGKPQPERAPGEPMDADAEWDRDGQYFHYLTRWMQALVQLEAATGDGRAAGYALDLAVAAHAGFVQQTGGRPSMVWKMSTDLARPLVATMGHQDPLDGLASTLLVRDAAGRHGLDGARLDGPLRDYAGLVEGRQWASSDPLGLGGLLMSAEQLATVDAHWKDLAIGLLQQAIQGVEAFSAGFRVDAPPGRRLGFRELGLAIGLGVCAERGRDTAVVAPELGQAFARLRAWDGLRAGITGFWLDPGNRKADSWLAHRDINEVMLATALVPAAVATGGAPVAHGMRSYGSASAIRSGSGAGWCSVRKGERHP